MKNHHPLRAQSLRFKGLEGHGLIESAVYNLKIKRAITLKEAPYSFQYMSVFINLNLKKPNFLHHLYAYINQKSCLSGQITTVTYFFNSGKYIVMKF